MYWRRLSSATALAIAALAIASPAAKAGPYVVQGCNGWAPLDTAPGYVAVYHACPGFVVRNVYGNFSSPGGAQAGWAFGAPAGTLITGVTLAGLMKGYEGWQAAAWVEGGHTPGGALQLQACPWSTCIGAETALGAFGVPAAAVIRLRVRCGTGCSNRNQSGGIFINSPSVTVDDVTPPATGITGGSILGGWRTGVHSISADAQDNTGIQALRAYVDGLVRTEQPRPGCNWGALIPCANGGGELAIDTRSLSDGPHTLMVQAIDTGGLPAADSRTIYVDNSAPSAPQGAKLDAGPVWKPVNAFDVSWTDPAQNAAPVVEAIYRLCPTGSTDAKRCVVGTQPRSAGKGKTSVQVPSPGDWTGKVWLRDAAGNHNEATAVTLEHLRFDPTPPKATIAPAETDNPTLIRVLASDEVSGIATGEVEVQRDGETIWRTLLTTVVSDGLNASIDDAQLPDGVYRVRARVVDLAGNERSTSELTSGSAASLSLPLRIKTRLAVGQVKRVRARGLRSGKARFRRVVVQRPRARYGRTIRLSGRLTTPGANPVAGAAVEVWERVALDGAQWTRTATVPTSRTGRFVFKALRGPSRLVQFRYYGTPTVRPRISTVELLIRGSSSLDVSDRRVVNGDEVVFRGHIRGRPLPPQGKLVELQVYTRRKWRTFAQPRADAASGRWSYRYRFESVRGNLRFKFRARVREEAGYPFQLGTSSRVSVLVRGVR